VPLGFVYYTCFTLKEMPFIFNILHKEAPFSLIVKHFMQVKDFLENTIFAKVP